MHVKNPVSPRAMPYAAIHKSGLPLLYAGMRTLPKTTVTKSVMLTTDEVAYLKMCAQMVSDTRDKRITVPDLLRETIEEYMAGLYGFDFADIMYARQGTSMDNRDNDETHAKPQSFSMEMSPESLDMLSRFTYYGGKLSILVHAAIARRYQCEQDPVQYFAVNYCRTKGITREQYEYMLIAKHRAAYAAKQEAALVAQHEEVRAAYTALASQEPPAAA